MITEERTWVVLADGGHAKVMQYDLPQGDLEMVPDGQFDQPNLPSRELVTDGPARGFVGTSTYAARGTIGSSADPHEHEEARFVARVAHFLDAHVEDYDNLIVVAAPKALGTLRQKFSSNVQKKVCAQLDKDLVQRPLDEVRQQVQQLMPALPQRH